MYYYRQRVRESIVSVSALLRVFLMYSKFYRLSMFALFPRFPSPPCDSDCYESKCKFG